MDTFALTLLRSIVLGFVGFSMTERGYFSRLGSSNRRRSRRAVWARVAGCTNSSRLSPAGRYPPVSSKKKRAGAELATQRCTGLVEAQASLSDGDASGPGRFPSGWPMGSTRHRISTRCDDNTGNIPCTYARTNAVISVPSPSAAHSTEAFSSTGMRGWSRASSFFAIIESQPSTDRIGD